MRPVDMWPEEFKDAPCYYHLPDDGAPMRCSDCGKSVNPTTLVWTFTPDGTWPQVLCTECIDEDWLKLATDKGVTKR